MKSVQVAVTAAALSSLGSATPVDKSQYPTNVEIDLVFPAANKTYNIGEDFPVVFAAQNANPFLTWHPYFHWEISASNNTDERPDAAGGRSMDGSLPPDIVDNIFYIAESGGKSSKMPPGQYTLNWTLSITTCTNNGRLKSTRSGDFLTGLVPFSTAADGSGTDVDFTAECPVYLGSLQSTGVESTTTEATGEILICPYVSLHEESKTNPCRAKMWKAMETCVNHNLTNFNTKDFAPCQKAIDEAPKNLGEGPQFEETEKNGTDGKGGNGTVKDDEEDGAMSVYGASNLLLGMGAVAALMVL